MTEAVQHPRQESMEDWLISRFAQLAGVSPDEIDIDRPFADYQLDSAVAVTMTKEFSAWLGRELSITLFWEYPTIRSLAAAIDV
ncbi:MAG: acyl carrier protein [Aquisalimonadaceae bacterium]